MEMQVYRVEDEDGGGPYNGDRAPKAFTPGWTAIVNGNPLGDRVSQPDPYSDIPKWATPFVGHARYRFGFKTVEQMHSWFHDEAKEELVSRGFKLAKYEVPDSWVHVGGHQVAFEPTKAKLLIREPLPTRQGDLFR
jgi:hypothetical protein